MTLNIQV